MSFVSSWFTHDVAVTDLFLSFRATSYSGIISENYVSLVANDMRIVFGGNEQGQDSDSLPPNSVAEYHNLFAFETVSSFDLTFNRTAISSVK